MTILCPKRLELKFNFLANSLNTKFFDSKSLLQDASLRSYYRISIKDKSYILMNCPPEHYCPKPFVKISQLLRSNGIIAPKIYHIDYDNGFLLLEDFGDISICKYLEENPNHNHKIYTLIIDILIKLQSIDLFDNLPLYSMDLFLSELTVYLEWYIPYATGGVASESQKQEFLDIWQKLLNNLPDIKPSIVYRDFHTQNMMLLNRTSNSSIGLIDFQDALIGNPIYDLVSLLEDARIDVSKQTANKFIDYYLSLTPDISYDDLLISYNILGAQRNCKILGIFARKLLRDNNKNYLKYIPRVLSYLKNDLSHDGLSSLRLWVEKIPYIMG